VALAFGCKKEIVRQTPIDQALYGSWTYSAYVDTIYVYAKSTNLVENKLGFTFNENGTFVERKINGWCATPPVVLSDYNGSWSIHDSIINISVGYWGGTVNYTWRVISLKDNQMKIAIKDITYHPDNNY